MRQAKLTAIATYRQLTKQIRALEKKRAKLPIAALGWRKTDRTYPEWGRKDYCLEDTYLAIIVIDSGGLYLWETAKDVGRATTLPNAKRAADAALVRQGVLL
jgi:hypothetical protein